MPATCEGSCTPRPLRPLYESTAHAGYVRGIVHATQALVRHGGGSSERVPAAADQENAFRPLCVSGMLLAFTSQHTTATWHESMSVLL